MIAFLRGVVAAREAGRVVVDVAGVGYLVHVADSAALPPRGEPVEVHTSLQVREDALDLYGFAGRDELELFELLMTATGVGPKLALAALSTHRAGTLRTALATGDVPTLTAVPGVGRKVAQRLVLELKDKVGLPVGTDVDETPFPGAATPLAEVRAALTALGYSVAEIQAALATVGTDSAGDVSGLLRLALRELGGTTLARTGSQ